MCPLLEYCRKPCLYTPSELASQEWRVNGQGLHSGFIPAEIDEGGAVVDCGTTGRVPEGAGAAKELFAATRYGATDVTESIAGGNAIVALDGAADAADRIDGCAEADAGVDEAAAEADEVDTPTHAYASASSFSYVESPIPVFHL